jgi:hypothetical protein
MCCPPYNADVKSLMPYELTFTKVVPIGDRDQCFNECCVGGDVVMDHLLPILRAKYEDIETNQEDWGWFAWFKDAGSNLAVDVFSDNPDAGEFRIHVTSNVPRFLFGAKVIDTPELESLLAMVVEAISKWTGQAPQIMRLDAKHMPLAKAT